MTLYFSSGLIMFYLANQQFLLFIILTLNFALPIPVFANNQSESLDLNPEIIKNSPVLQRWLEKIPNVLQDIENDPSFRTRVKLGYTEFPSTQHQGGVNVGVEDVFLGNTGLTVSANYQASFNGDRELTGGDLNYYILPLGNYINIAPAVGYRYFQTNNYSTDGVNVGVKIMFTLSRNGAADVSLIQSFIDPGGNDEVGLSTLAVGYAITNNLRISTEIQQQNSQIKKDSSVGIFLEWMP